MKNHFYSHLIEIDTISRELAGLNLHQKEHNELLSIVRVQIHHVAVDTVLSQLSEEQKKEFFRHLASGKHDKIWRLVNKHVQDAEKKIKLAVDKLLIELINDVKDSVKE